ncbi:response regulator [Patescibacteria group bacterium]|nr:response regulator [Patescibacteria group bacterium]
MKILVIEDAPELAGALDDLLKMKGYITLVENSGTRGLQVALTEHPDLILLDLRLPDLDGAAVLRELRKDEWGKTAHVLMLTASDMSEDAPKDIGLPREKILQKWHWGIENIAARVEAELINSQPTVKADPAPFPPVQ